MPPAAHELCRARTTRDMPQHIIGKRRSKWRPDRARSIHSTRFANDLPTTGHACPRRRKREQDMWARPPCRGIHQRRPPDGNRRDRLHDQQQRPLREVRVEHVAKPQIDVRSNRHIPARTRSRSHSSSQHGRPRSVRVVSYHPARFTLATVIEHLDERRGCGRFGVIGGDRVHAHALASGQVPRMRGRIRTIAVMQQSAHAASQMQPGRRGRSLKESGQSTREMRSFFRSHRGRSQRFLERCARARLPRRPVRRSAQRGGGSPEGEGGACPAEAPEREPGREGGSYRMTEECSDF